MTLTLPGHSAPAVGFEVPLEMLAACHGRVQHQCETLHRLLAHLKDHLNRIDGDDRGQRLLGGGTDIGSDLVVGKSRHAVNRGNHLGEVEIHLRRLDSGLLCGDLGHHRLVILLLILELLNTDHLSGKKVL